MLTVTNQIEPFTDSSKDVVPILAESDSYRRLYRDLRRYTTGQIQGRSYLIAGHRGSGKSMLVYKVIEDLLRDSLDRPQRPLFVRLHGPDLLPPIVNTKRVENSQPPGATPPANQIAIAFSGGSPASVNAFPQSGGGDTADAEMVIEGHVLANVKEVEGPFGEFTGYYGPQRLRNVIEVSAITHRSDAIFQHIFTGHRDTWVLGGIPKEGSLFNLIRGVVPTVKAVHFPFSGGCRFNCYISIDKKVDGETKQAALVALGGCDFVKHVVVVDADIDIYNEEEVMWAVATRVQADQDVDVIKNVKGNTLDPSQTDNIMTAKMIIDATKPVQRPYEARVAVPKTAMEKTRLEEFIPRAVLDRVPKV